MKYRSLRPDQIITLRDYPLYNQHILRIYFRVFSKNQGKILPPVPVIHKSLGIPLIKSRTPSAKKHNQLLSTFLEKNPAAEYFLLDGSHKTTAATLSKKKISVVIMETDKDFKVAKKLIKSGEIFGWHSPKNSIDEAINELAKHHRGSERFLTVEDKSKLLVKNKDVPNYIISFFKSRK
ncbi:hypothetical protein CMO92_02565 [Candidatus Woesearchaeota archaeon]|nr:hypothetical protein [Candidatus Woesearchaeota archaeon]